MVNKEALLMRDGLTDRINQRLVEFFPGRTLKAIKSRRKKKDFRRLVMDSETLLGIVENRPHDPPLVPREDEEAPAENRETQGGNGGEDLFGSLERFRETLVEEVNRLLGSCVGVYPHIATFEEQDLKLHASRLLEVVMGKMGIGDRQRVPIFHVANEGRNVHPPRSEPRTPQVQMGEDPASLG